MDLFGTGVTQDAHFFYWNYLTLNAAAGAAGGYYATPTDVSKWMRSFLRGDLTSAEILEEAKHTMLAPGLPAITYNLGINKRNFIGYTGYGKGGDLAYSSSSWYFPELDCSITVCGNDAEYISWELISVVTELLRTLEENIALSQAEIKEHRTGVNAYPNPVKDQLTIQLPIDCREVIVFNALGQCVFRQKLDEPTSNTALNTSARPIGVYSLMATGSDFHSTLQIVKE